MTTLISKRYSRFLFPGLILALVSVLYVALLTALPKYAGRVPFLAVLFIVDWLVFSDLKRHFLRFPLWVRGGFALFWWLPVSLLFIFLIGSVFLPLQEWDDFLRIYLPGIALITIISKMTMFTGLLPAYLLRFISFVAAFFRKGRGIHLHGMERLFRNAGIFLASIVLILMTIGSVYWVYRFRVHEVVVPVKDLPARLDGLKIVQLSDMHLGSWVSVKPMKRAVDQVMSLKPDLVVFTGDMVNYSTAEVEGFDEVLSQITAPYGVFAVLGNHDYGDYTAWESDSAKQKNLTDMEDFYRRIGWKLLRNESELIVVDSSELLVAGVENWSATARFRKYGDLQKTVEGTRPGDLNLLLSHDPTHWDAEVKALYPMFDLTLSGHTHGMQMGFETPVIRWSPSQYLYSKWAGLYRHTAASGKENFLYINRGLGHIGYPGRIGILPEITLIRLKRT